LDLVHGLQHPAITPKALQPLVASESLKRLAQTSARLSQLVTPAIPDVGSPVLRLALSPVIRTTASIAANVALCNPMGRMEKHTWWSIMRNFDGIAALRNSQTASLQIKLPEMSRDWFERCRPCTDESVDHRPTAQKEWVRDEVAHEARLVEASFDRVSEGLRRVEHEVREVRLSASRDAHRIRRQAIRRDLRARRFSAFHVVFSWILHSAISRFIGSGRND